ncbi:IS3 family transposase [Alteromonas gracilis]|uniref:IS3 family transposase n=2 Tax=Alteromonas gracilis TaxID=1479524 RepID=A0ABX5CRG2_9ALTE|nr:IS3 family transposase [Alteromonas gracilis]PRO70159.1 IS3 family transposase [Alteromonas gracilis]
MGGVSEGTKSEKFSFINERRDEFGIRYLCTQLQVSTSGFYKWLHKGLSHRQALNTELTKEIYRLYTLHKGNYGSPRIHKQLQAQGWQVNHKRVERIMREQKLVGKAAKIYRRHALPENTCNKVGNLILNHAIPPRPNQQWCGDVSYLKLNGQFIYLAVVLDMYSRKVIGWSLDRQRKVSLTIDALDMAVKSRQLCSGLIFHSDKGTEYACHDYQNHLKKCGIKPSMNRPGKMTDNIYVETFFRTFKTETYHGERFKDESHLRKTTQWYIEENYNNQRIHSSLNFKTPQQYESM